MKYYRDIRNLYNKNEKNLTGAKFILKTNSVAPKPVEIDGPKPVIPENYDGGIMNPDEAFEH